MILFLPVANYCFSYDVKQADVLKLLKEGVDNKEYSHVILIANKYSDEYLGDPEFDFLYGIAALATNDAERSVFAFERVVANRPNWLDARFYLARSYFETANYQAAMQQCQNILDSNESRESLKDSAERLCDQANQKLIAQSTSIQQRVGASIGHDSNINAGTREERIFLPFLEEIVQLGDESTEQNDEYVNINYLVNMSNAITQTSKVNISAQASAHSFIQESEYNRLAAQVRVDYLSDFDAIELKLGGRYTPLWFDGSYYRSQTALLAGVKSNINDSWVLYGNAMFGKTNNNENDLLDTDDYSLSMASDYYVDNWRYSFSVERIKEDGEIESNSRTIDAISISSLWLANRHWLGSLWISYQKHDYDGKHPFYLQQRDDDLWMMSSFIQYNMSKSLSYRLNINMQDKDSNLSLFSYERTDVSLSASMSF